MDEAGAAFSGPVMDEGGSRIRRRVSVGKRNRPSLGSSFAVPTAAQLQSGDEQEEEEEIVAGSRRRKTEGVQPVEVQPHELSNSPEGLVLLTTFGALIQTWASYFTSPSKGVKNQVQMT